MKEYIPTPNEKREHLLEVFKRRKHSVFIESGSHEGATARFFNAYADTIVSVEIDPVLFKKLHRDMCPVAYVNSPPDACTCGGPRFILGDSTEWIPKLVREATPAPLVYLDGHYSGEGTGMGSEVEPACTILRTMHGRTYPEGTTVVVDDLRLFGAIDGYPTLDELVAAARGAFPKARIYCALDALVVEAP